MKKVAFIGTGNMGGALIRAACRAVGPEQVVITDPAAEKAAALCAELGCLAVPSNAEAVQAAKYVFLCVKPQIMPGMVKALSPALGEDNVLITIAAGLKMADILADLGKTVPMLRIMPNTCAAIGQGMIALTAMPGVDECHWQAVEEILSCAGRVERLEEAKIDAFTALAGSGPAYVDLFIEALADGAVMAGLTRQQALTYAAQTVMGSAAMILQSGKHPGVLKDEVCSPAGSTIAGVAVLEQHSFRYASMEAVMAAYRKNIDLGKR